MNTTQETMYVVARILLWTCALVAVAFPLIYHRETNGTWSFTPIGRHIMQFWVLFATMLIVTALSVFLPIEVVLGMAIMLYMAALVVIVNQIRFVLSPSKMDPQRVLSSEDGEAQVSRLLIREDHRLMKSRPVVIIMSILAGLQFLFGGLTALNLPDGSYNEIVLTIGAFGTLAVAAAQFGLQFYVQNLVTPHEDVAAFRDKTGQIVAGPAAPPEGENVDVVNEDTGRLH